MNELDALILAVIGLSAVLGAVRGMLTEVLSLLLWVVALWVTVTMGDTVTAQLRDIDTPLLRAIAGYAGTFVVIMLIGNLLIWALRSLLHGVGLSSTDRALGAGFGVARGAAVVVAAVLLVSFTPMPNTALWQSSALLPAFEWPAAKLAAQLPDSESLLAAARPALQALPLDALPLTDLAFAATLLPLQPKPQSDTGFVSPDRPRALDSANVSQRPAENP